MLIYQDLHILPIPLQAKHYLMHLQLYITAPLLLRCASGWGGWLVPDRCFQYLHSWHRRQAQVECCSWVCLPALWTPCAEQARRQDSVIKQVQSPFALSRILIPTSVTRTAQVAEPLSSTQCSVFRQWEHGDSALPCPYPASPGDKAVAEVPFSAMKSHSVLATQEMSGDIQQLHLLWDRITALCFLQLWV